MNQQVFQCVNVKCSQCHLKNICLPTRLIDSEVEHLESVIQRRKVLNKGDKLVEAGEDFNYLYAVSSGSFKTFGIYNDGTYQVTNFHYPGEIIGLNSVGFETFQSYTVALETASVCTIKFKDLEEIMRIVPRLRMETLRLMSKEIKQEQKVIGIICHSDATKKVVAFLLDLSRRYQNQGLSGEEFRITMTRTDIGNYLGLAMESICRQLSLLSAQGLIVIREGYIKLSNLQKLHALVDLT